MNQNLETKKEDEKIFRDVASSAVTTATVYGAAKEKERDAPSADATLPLLHARVPLHVWDPDAPRNNVSPQDQSEASMSIGGTQCVCALLAKAQGTLAVWFGDNISVYKTSAGGENDHTEEVSLHATANVPCKDHVVQLSSLLGSKQHMKFSHIKATYSLNLNSGFILNWCPKGQVLICARPFGDLHLYHVNIQEKDKEVLEPRLYISLRSRPSVPAAALTHEQDPLCFAQVVECNVTLSFVSGVIACVSFFGDLSIFMFQVPLAKNAKTKSKILAEYSLKPWLDCALSACYDSNSQTIFVCGNPHSKKQKKNAVIPVTLTIEKSSDADYTAHLATLHDDNSLHSKFSPFAKLTHFFDNITRGTAKTSNNLAQPELSNTAVQLDYHDGLLIALYCDSSVVCFDKNLNQVAQFDRDLLAQACSQTTSDSTPDAAETHTFKDLKIERTCWWPITGYKNVFTVFLAEGHIKGLCALAYPSLEPVTSFFKVPDFTTVSFAQSTNGCITVLQCAIPTTSLQQQQQEQEKDLAAAHQKTRHPSMLTRTLRHVTNTVLWHFDDTEETSAIPAKSNQKQITAFSSELFELRTQQPAEAVVDLLFLGLFEKALCLAKKHNLDTNLVYQAHWAALPNTASLLERCSILDNISDKEWVLQACIDLCPAQDTFVDDYRAIMHYALRLTEPAKDYHNSGLEERFYQSLLHARLLILRSLDFLEYFIQLYGVNALGLEFMSFRAQNIFRVACNLAEDAEFESLHRLFEIAPNLAYFRMAVVSQVPPFFAPREYEVLLPDLENTRCCELNCGPGNHNNAGLEKDWVFAFAKQACWKSDYVQVLGYLNTDNIAQWYVDHAIHLESQTGCPENAIQLLQYAQSTLNLDNARLDAVLKWFTAFAHLVNSGPEPNEVTESLSFLEFIAAPLFRAVELVFTTLLCKSNMTYELPDLINLSSASSTRFVGIINVIDPSWVTLKKVLVKHAATFTTQVRVAFQALCTSPNAEETKATLIEIAVSIVRALDFVDVHKVNEANKILDLVLPFDKQNLSLQELQGCLLAAQVLVHVGVKMSVRAIQGADQLNLVSVVLDLLGSQQDALWFDEQLQKLMQAGYLKVPEETVYQLVFPKLLRLKAFTVARTYATRLPLSVVTDELTLVSDDFVKAREYQPAKQCLEVLPIVELEKRAKVVESAELLSSYSAKGCISVQEPMRLLAEAVDVAPASVLFKAAELIGLSKFETWLVAAPATASLQTCQRYCQLILDAGCPEDTEMQKSAAAALTQVIQKWQGKLSNANRILEYCFYTAHGAQLRSVLDLYQNTISKHEPNIHQKNFNLDAFYTNIRDVKQIFRWLSSRDYNASGTRNLETSLKKSTHVLPLLSMLPASQSNPGCEFQELLLFALTLQYISTFKVSQEEIEALDCLSLARKVSMDQTTDDKQKLLQARIAGLLLQVDSKLRADLKETFHGIPELDTERFANEKEYRTVAVHEFILDNEFAFLSLSQKYPSELAPMDLCKAWVACAAKSKKVNASVSNFFAMLRDIDKKTTSLKPLEDEVIKALNSDAKVNAKSTMYEILQTLVPDMKEQWTLRVALCACTAKICEEWDPHKLIQQFFTNNRAYFTALFKQLFVSLANDAPDDKIEMLSFFSSTLAVLIPQRRLIEIQGDVFEKMNENDLKSAYTAVYLRKVLRAQPSFEKKADLLVEHVGKVTQASDWNLIKQEVSVALQNGVDEAKLSSCQAILESLAQWDLDRHRAWVFALNSVLDCSSTEEVKMKGLRSWPSERLLDLLIRESTSLSWSDYERVYNTCVKAFAWTNANLEQDLRAVLFKVCAEKNERILSRVSMALASGPYMHMFFELMDQKKE